VETEHLNPLTYAAEFTLQFPALEEVVAQLEPDGLLDLDLDLRGWLELP
jgi:hypothetical protein